MTTELQACFVDLAQEDGISASQIAQLQTEGTPWTGVSMQCSNGTYTFPAWFPAAWKAAGPGEANPQYGKTKFRMAYHYLVVGMDPVKQADCACDAVEGAGGWANGDLAMGVDIESGEQSQGITAADVEGHISAFAAQILNRTKRHPILYAGSLIRQLGITSRMGCGYLWIPEWDAAGKLDWNLVTQMGWDEASTLLWQFSGDGSATAPPGYPHTTPVGDQLDISVIVLNNMPYEQQIQWLVSYCSQAVAASPTA